MTVMIVAWIMTALCVIATVWISIRHIPYVKKLIDKNKRSSYMTLKANRASARLLKDYTGIFGYSAPMKMENETNSGAIQTSEERFYFRVQHGKKVAIYGAYSGDPISESILEDLELNDKSAITPVWIKWEGK